MTGIPVPPETGGPTPLGGPPATGRLQRRRIGGDVVGGLILVAIGAFLLAGQFVPSADRYVPLAVGLVLLVLFLLVGTYGLLIPACIVTGIGVGLALAGDQSGEASGAIIPFFLGCGFLAIWAVGLVLRLPENHWWPLIPGGILTTTGAALATEIRGEPLVDLIALILPIPLIAGGVLLILRTAAGRRSD